MERYTEENGIHYIFLADDLGIASIFPTLKQKLAEPGHQHVSLLYCSANSHHIFRKELEILQTHFPSQLFVSYHAKALSGHWPLEQEDIEAVINANTMPQMKFIVSGNTESVQRVSSVLNFLGIKNIQIQEQYFSE
jgi:ferredoxin-NADP reductase